MSLLTVTYLNYLTCFLSVLDLRSVRNLLIVLALLILLNLLTELSVINLLNLLNSFTTASLHIKPTGRMFHNAVLNKNHNKNEIWMLGGIQQPPGINRTCLEDCSGPISNGLWKYNIDENTWCYNNVSFPKRRGSSIISNNDFIYIQGGGITNTKNPFLSIPLSIATGFK